MELLDYLIISAYLDPKYYDNELDRYYHKPANRPFNSNYSSQSYPKSAYERDREFYAQFEKKESDEEYYKRTISELGMFKKNK